MEQGHLDEAKAKIQEEIKRTPSSVEAYNMLGFLYTQQKDYPSAKEAFDRGLKIAPDSTQTHNGLGNLYVAEGNIDSAEKEFRTTLRLEPVNQEANYNLGLLLIGKRQPDQAIRYLERVRPANLPTRFNLVRAYLEDKRTQEALRIASELSEQNKGDVQLHFTLGVLLASEKQYKDAALELERADAIQPGTFEILYNLGQAYVRDGDNAKAEIALNRALKVKPDSPETLSQLAQVYSNESRPLDALDLLTRAHKISPENPDIIFQMAQVSISQNYFEDAIPLLESGLRIAPQRTDLTAALGESYFMSGKVQKAIEVFKKLLQMDRSSRAYLYLGLAYESMGRFDEATHYFQEGLKLNRNDSSCMFHLGYIAERQGDDDGAEAKFQAVLRSNPDFADALLELANIRMAKKRYAEAVELLKRYVKVSRNPATGYYKLAMAERSLHETAAADRDLNVFQTLSKNTSTGSYPYEHLFDYVDNRSKLAPRAREQMDIAELNDEIKKHPDQPEDLYMLAEAYLKSGKPDEARQTIAELDKLSSEDYRTEAGAGVLLARYRMYEDAIRHFRLALAANPNSDEVKFDIADAYFRKGLYSEALDAVQQISLDGRKDDAYLALLGDIYAHLGEIGKAEEIFRDAISRNPDNDQDYLSLALLQIRSNGLAGARETLLKGQARVPGSGKILWGLGLVSVVEGNTTQAEKQLARAVDLLPEWPGSYSTLGVFYFQTGQIDKAKEVLDRFKNSNVGGLDVDRIEQVLAQASPNSAASNAPMPMASREQLLQLALSLADRTL
ncbi:MAG: tetratricopeptide repeat protein [Acidobacteriaceae bacterium]|nr:tetratricopeptide repeat protein [Acidobacteriaceae bacterium]